MAAVVRSGTISAAAREANLTQPAITQAIAKLEGVIGLRLFDRGPGGMTPTRFATLLMPRTETALALISNHRVTAAQARAFLAVARSGGYAAAAAISGISNASLHRAVADLALAYRTPLLERRGSGVVLTASGRRISRRLMLAQAELAAGLDEIASEAGREIGRIVIGAMPLSRARLLPNAIRRVHVRHPRFRVVVVEGSHGELVGPLRGGEIDLMLGALRPELPGSDLVQRPLFEDRPVVIGRAGHPLAGQAPDLAGLAGYPWTIPAPSAPLRVHWERMFGDAGLPLPDLPVECGSVITIREILAHSDFLTLLSPDQVAVELAAGILAIIRSAPPGIVRTIGMTSRATWRPTPLQQRMLTELESVVSEVFANSYDRT